MAISMGLAARILGSMGVKATVVASNVMPAPAAVQGHGTSSTAQVPAVTMPARTAEKSALCWFNGIITAVLASAAVVAAASFLNTLGYSRFYVVGEGLPLGLAIGYGLWQGLKRLTRTPSASSLLLAPLVLSLLFCGGLVTGHYLCGDPVLVTKAQQKEILPTGKLFSPEERAESIKKLYGGDTNKAATTPGVRVSVQQRLERETQKVHSNFKPATFVGGLNLNNINAIMFILGQVLLTIFVSVMTIINKFKSAPSRR
jgi:hypothetical protein